MTNEVIRGNFGRRPGQPARYDEDSSFVAEAEESLEEKVREAIRSICELRSKIGDDFEEFENEYLEFVGMVIRDFSLDEQHEILVRVGIRKEEDGEDI